MAAPLGVLELDAKDALLWRFYTRFVEAVRLCWVEGYTQEEAAQMLGVTQSAMRNRLKFARKHAQTVLKTPFWGYRVIDARIPMLLVSAASDGAERTRLEWARKKYGVTVQAQGCAGLVDR